MWVDRQGHIPLVVPSSVFRHPDLTINIVVILAHLGRTSSLNRHCCCCTSTTRRRRTTVVTLVRLEAVHNHLPVMTRVV
jgi:hypothetical protein